MGNRRFTSAEKRAHMYHCNFFSVPLLIGGAAYMHFEGKQELAMQAGDAQTVNWNADCWKR